MIYEFCFTLVFNPLIIKQLAGEAKLILLHLQCASQHTVYQGFANPKNLEMYIADIQRLILISR